MKNAPIYLLLLLAITSRFLPHPANFTAVGAIALFSGLYLSKKEAYILPLATMVLSDIFIGFYKPAIMASVYLGFIITIFIGQTIKNKISLFKVFTSVIIASFSFFIITNAAVWLFGTMYPHDIYGLMTSYYMALPFWKNQIIGDLFYTGILVGGYEMIKNYSHQYILEK